MGYNFRIRQNLGVSDAAILRNVAERLIVVSGSSDRTLLLWPCQPPGIANGDPSWNPTPSPIGAHSDYVRTLCYSSQQNWVASGGLDRRICVWDLGEGRKDPLKSMWGVPLPQEAASSEFRQARLLIKPD